MKPNCFKYVLIIIIIIYSSLQIVKTDNIKHEIRQSEINKPKPFRFCGADQLEDEIIKEEYFNPGEIVNKNKRYLDKEEEYKQIRIFLDTTYIIYQGEKNSNLNNMISKVIFAMEKCVKTLEKLLKVIPRKSNIKFSLDEVIKYNIEKINTTLENEGIPADLIIFSRIANDNELSVSTLANAGAKVLEFGTNRPYIGVVSINPEIEFSLGNSLNYLESILLHEFTHILGFSYSLFNYFPGGLANTVFTRIYKRIGLNRTYVKTTKLVEIAKKYFNCDRIEGIELEDQGGSGTAGSHWEARILLGDYMNGNLYTIEQVISEFTLAVLEDSGWYKINYFTGGLMRFGKNQGCEFIEEDCLNSTELETKFNNDFFNIFDNYEPRCSSGRQSRGYNLLYKIDKNSIENKEYLRFGDKFGSRTADYCPVCQEYSPTSYNLYYVGNCQKGNFIYASRIYFGSYGYESEEIPIILGEKYAENSFCSLSSVIPKINGNNIYKQYKITHPVCYPMLCSEKSLTIQINEQYIVCPRQGGKISISKNYEGFIYCPDYNLICTGTVLCNDMFDCVEKESLIKNNTYDYDYIMNNSQDIDQIEESDILIGYELSNDGVCPKDCVQCLINKKCFQCKDGFNLVGKKENDLEPIICSNNIDISTGYYKLNNIYYECLKDCINCSNGSTCNKCIKNKRLNYYKNECVDKVVNCELYDINENCIRCISNYSFIGTDRTKCINTEDKNKFDINKYYTEDNGISYFPCDTLIKYCDECSVKNKCDKCISSYVILDNNNSICINKKELEDSKTAFKIDEYNYKSCNLAINNCVTCNSGILCLSCGMGYGIFNDKHNECVTLEGKENKYYFEESNNVYYFCNKTLKNCEECSDKYNCTLCKNGYDFDLYNICVNMSFLIDYFIDKDNNKQNCSDYIDNCKFCSSEDYCNYCNYYYSFLNNTRNKCISAINFNQSNNYYTLDNGINYYNCEYDSDIKGIGNCSKCIIENNKLKCITCKELFAFLDDDIYSCHDIINELNDKIKNKIIYSLDNGINYYTCEKQIEKCESCMNSNVCLKCLENNAFLNDDFSKCYSKKNFEIGYFSNENETIYYPCLDNCAKCENNNTCIKCLLNFTFIGYDRTKCINTEDKNVFDITKYYTEDEGISYFPCNTTIEHCNECSLKSECDKCISSYVILDNNKSICINKKELEESKKAFKIDEYNYKSCNLAINKCITCNSDNYCLSCENGYGIINDIHTKCELLTGKENKLYYNEINGVYYSCNKSLKYCEECLDNDTCTLCLDNYILPFKETKCIDIDKDKIYYYFDNSENNYKRCNYGVNNCLKCYSENKCAECENSYTLINNNTEQCELKSLYEDNKEYITLDKGINYYKCDIFINNCFKCKLNSEKNNSNCFNCKDNFTLLDDNLLKCYNINDELIGLIENKEIFTNDHGINYYTCSKRINNCEKCENENNCLLCSPDYALYEDDNINCYSKNKFKIGFFSDENEIRYYSCLPNCDKCQNKTICEKCSINYMPNENNTECIEKIVDINELKKKCIININTISDEDFELIINNNKSLTDYILEYQQVFKNTNYALILYLNNKYNFSMILFKYSECSIFLIENGNQKISTENLIVNLGNNLNNNLVYIQAYIQFNNKTSYSIYDSITAEKVNIKDKCLNCKEYQIISNYTNSIMNYIGNNTLLLIQNENINLFNEKENIFNDICQNMTINNFDYPFEERKSKFYLNNKNLILCGAQNCNLIKDNINNSTSLCSCPIDDNDNLENIFNTQENISENNINDVNNNVNYNTLYIFKCLPNLFKLNNIKNNVGFYISISVIGVTIICYIWLLSVNSFPKSLNVFQLNAPPKNYKINESNEKVNNNKNIEEKNGIDLGEIDIKITDTDKRFQNNSSKNQKGKINDLFLDYLSFKNAKKQDKRSFCYYYCHLLLFNQLFLNLCSCCSCSISESFIPFPLKLIKILFLCMINLFINSILTNNKYIIEKYNYFNEKYDIENNKIDSINNEIVLYSIKNGKIQIIISFFICLLLHYLLGCLFNIRKKIYILLKNEKLEVKEKINKKSFVKIKNSINCIFNCYAIICLLFMIAIFVYLTLFCIVYSGTIIDVISQSITCFIILQICPFVICFFVSSLRYLGLNGDCPLLFLVNKCLSGL